MKPIAVVVPCFGHQASLDRVLLELSRIELALMIVVVDDGSPVPLQASGPRIQFVRHPRNLGYGAAQKTGYALALAKGAERVVLLHGDGQYPTDQSVNLATQLDHADAVIGSRFSEDRGARVPPWRRWGNRLLTTTANLRMGTHYSELHSGARAFRAEALLRLPLESFSDDFVFDQQVLIHLVAEGMTLTEYPIDVRYDDTVSSISFRRSVTYGLGCLWTIATQARRTR